MSTTTGLDKPLAAIVSPDDDAARSGQEKPLNGVDGAARHSSAETPIQEDDGFELLYAADDTRGAIIGLHGAVADGRLDPLSRNEQRAASLLHYEHFGQVRGFAVVDHRKIVALRINPVMSAKDPDPNAAQSRSTFASASHTSMR